MTGGEWAISVSRDAAGLLRLQSSWAWISLPGEVAACPGSPPIASCVHETVNAAINHWGRHSRFLDIHALPRSFRVWLCTPAVTILA